MTDTVKKILVVEDERSIAKAIALKLEKTGYVPVVANNGKEGLDLIKQGHFDVILLDLIMPVMDGFQVLEALQGQLGIPPILVLSNLPQPDDATQVIRLGARKFLVKSDTSLEAIVEEIEQARATVSPEQHTQ